jgi:glycosyltransferase involved in cell wall biosynthesis
MQPKLNNVGRFMYVYRSRIVYQMQSRTDLYVVGCTGHFYEKKEGYSVETEGVKQYLEYFDSEFEKVDFFTLESQDDRSTTETLDIEEKSIHPQPYDSRYSFLKGYVKNALSLLLKPSPNEKTSLLFIPDLFSFLMAYPVMLKSDNIVLYYMSDTSKVEWGSQSISTAIKNNLYSVTDSLLLSRCDVVLYRDESVKLRSKRPDDIFVRSNPIVALTKGDIHLREDTCEQEPIQILFVGTLSNRKGISYLLSALNRLETESKHCFEVNIVGGGSDRDKFIKEAKDIGVYESVRFKGHITSKSKLLNEYRKNDIFVLPSLLEGYPRVLVEAMSQSLPVITTSVGEIPEQINNDQAVIVPPKSAKELSSAIKLVADDEEFRKSLITNGRKKATETLSKSAAEQHANIINSLCQYQERYEK